MFLKDLCAIYTWSPINNPSVLHDTTPPLHQPLLVSIHPQNKHGLVLTTYHVEHQEYSPHCAGSVPASADYSEVQ